MTDSNENPQKKKRLRDWESAVEKTIREAVERGDFDNLAGKGKPQDLSINPFLPHALHQAYRLLENAGVAPDWIELDKEIRVEKDALGEMLRQQTAWFKARTARSNTFAPERLIAEHEQLARSRELITARYRDRAARLNQMIDLFNLKAPISNLSQARIQIEQELGKFLQACK